MASEETGTIMWARTGKVYWPAMTLPERVKSKSERKGFFWVFWFGDHRISEVTASNTLEFKNFFKTETLKAIGQKPIKWCRGLHEALKYYGGPGKEEWDEEKLLNWGLNGFDETTPINDAIPLPDIVIDAIDKVSICDITPRKPAIKLIRGEGTLEHGKIDINTQCLGCYSNEIVDTHPIFNGSVCTTCRERLKGSLFFIGEDRIHWCCLICGDYGDLQVCSKITCGRAYCTTCIDNLSSKEVRKGIEENEDWLCYICDRKTNSNGSIVCRVDWREKIRCFYDVKYHPAPTIPLKKRKIRVLSLFDGIASVLEALNKMNLAVDKYFVSEIDMYSIFITKKSYHHQISYLGDVRELTDDVLESLLPIHLFVGGSPCEELSIANPNRQGLLDCTRSGILFYFYFRSLMTLKRINGEPFFWLFENVASMSAYNKNLISSCFNSEPIIINSSWVSPQKRNRLFWGNCPSMFGRFERDGPILQDYLLPGRTATVEKIRTITTGPNSLMQGSTLPVLTEDGKGDTFHINEIEKIFGFRADYTKHHRLSRTKRLCVLGKSWGVQVSCLLLHSLKYYYLLSDDVEEEDEADNKVDEVVEHNVVEFVQNSVNVVVKENVGDIHNVTENIIEDYVENVNKDEKDLRNVAHVDTNVVAITLNDDTEIIIDDVVVEDVESIENTAAGVDINIVEEDVCNIVEAAVDCICKENTIDIADNAVYDVAKTVVNENVDQLVDLNSAVYNVVWNVRECDFVDNVEISVEDDLQMDTTGEVVVFKAIVDGEIENVEDIHNITANNVKNVNKDEKDFHNIADVDTNAVTIALNDDAEIIIDDILVKGVDSIENTAAGAVINIVEEDVGYVVEAAVDCISKENTSDVANNAVYNVVWKVRKCDFVDNVEISVVDDLQMDTTGDMVLFEDIVDDKVENVGDIHNLTENNFNKDEKDFRNIADVDTNVVTIARNDDAEIIIDDVLVKDVDSIENTAAGVVINNVEEDIRNVVEAAVDCICKENTMDIAENAVYDVAETVVNENVERHVEFNSAIYNVVWKARESDFVDYVEISVEDDLQMDTTGDMVVFEDIVDGKVENVGDIHKTIENIIEDYVENVNQDEKDFRDIADIDTNVVAIALNDDAEIIIDDDVVMNDVDSIENTDVVIIIAEEDVGNIVEDVADCNENTIDVSDNAVYDVEKTVANENMVRHVELNSALYNVVWKVRECDFVDNVEISVEDDLQMDTTGDMVVFENIVDGKVEFSIGYKLYDGYRGSVEDVLKSDEKNVEMIDYDKIEVKDDVTKVGDVEVGNIAERSCGRPKTVLHN